MRAKERSSNTHRLWALPGQPVPFLLLPHRPTPPPADGSFPTLQSWGGDVHKASVHGADPICVAARPSCACRVGCARARPMTRG